MRRKVLICDDQQRFLDEFVRRHKDHYEITSLRDSSRVLHAIADAKELPDVVVLDLYFPIDETAPDFERKVETAEAELKKLDQQIAVTKQAVLAAWTPHGIELLKAIRQRCDASKLPVVIFTQKGLLLLDDAQIRSVEEQDGHWLLKGQLSRETERIRLDRIISYDAPSTGRNVFIGHGRNPQWEELRDHLQNNLRLPWVEFNKESPAGIMVFQRLWDMVLNSAFAFLIMTGEDERVDGELHARENVIHEIGLLQARLGPHKAIVLLEEGCQEFSNIKGLNQIQFPRNNIKAAFGEIEKVLRRERVITDD